MGLGDGSVVSTHADAWLMKQPFCDSRMWWRVDSVDLWGLQKKLCLNAKGGGHHLRQTPNAKL